MIACSSRTRRAPILDVDVDVDVFVCDVSRRVVVCVKFLATLLAGEFVTVAVVLVRKATSCLRTPLAGVLGMDYLYREQGEYLGA